MHTLNTAKVELVVTPIAWKPETFGSTIRELLNWIETRDLVVVSLVAEPHRLALSLPLDGEQPAQHYFDLATEIRSALEAAVPPSAPEAAALTRAELEDKLRQTGFVPSSEVPHQDARPHDKDIWSLPDSPNRCVQFDERTGPDESGIARWITTFGEAVLPFDQIAAELASLAASPAAPIAG